METLAEVLNGFLHSFGFSEGMVFSAATIRSGICFCLVAVVILSVIRGVKGKSKVSLENYLLSLFFACAVAIFVTLYAFVSVRYIDRYNLPILVFAFLIMALNLRDLSWQIKWKKLACIGVTAMLVLNSVITYRSYTQLDYTRELREIEQILSQSDYHAGYATFWNANVLTELSNGEIDVYDWCDGNETSMSTVRDVNQTYEWLQLTSHKTETPEGPVFLLFRPFEYDASNWKEGMKLENLLYQSEEYIVYGYDSYDRMVEEIYR